MLIQTGKGRILQTTLVSAGPALGILAYVTGPQPIGHKLSLWRRCQAAILALWPLSYSPTMGVEWSSQADRYVER
ncbi:MAG: hypothetical protein M3Q29_17840, partial [Chloroflexota bacterium]|nr:hypothetical protein [Chloroflexota bacterium]